MQILSSTFKCSLIDYSSFNVSLLPLMDDRWFIVRLDDYNCLATALGYESIQIESDATNSTILSIPSVTGHA